MRMKAACERAYVEFTGNTNQPPYAFTGYDVDVELLFENAIACKGLTNN